MQSIIAEERLKPEDIRIFGENAFRDGEIKTAGTDREKTVPISVPAVSRQLCFAKTLISKKYQRSTPLF